MLTTVTLNILSGQPNPEWKLEHSMASELREKIARLPLSNRRAQFPDGLGYRGFLVHFADGMEARIFRTFVSIGGETKTDEGKTIEKWIYHRADKGLPHAVQNAMHNAIFSA